MSTIVSALAHYVSRRPLLAAFLTVGVADLAQAFVATSFA